MNWLSNQLQYKDMSDWYKITIHVQIKINNQFTNQDLEKFGGKHLLNKYNSLLALITSIYPQFDWIPWKFEKLPPNFWEDMKNQNKFLSFVSNKLSVLKPEDWYKIPQRVFSRHF